MLTQAMQAVNCNDCGTEWDVTYNLSSVDLRKAPDKHNDYSTQSINQQSLSQIEIIKVKSSSVLDKIGSQFDVFTRPDFIDEIIMDCSCFMDNDERKIELRNVLGSEEDGIFSLNGYVLFHC
jgi:predicted glycoside hydrolase/deacetylase ChbG (UPF0249 family)